VLPGAEAVLARMNGPEANADEQVAVVDLTTGEADVLAVATRIAYASGYLVMSTVDGTLLAQPFDVKKRQRTGQAVAILDGVGVAGPAIGEYAVSMEGGAGLPGSRRSFRRSVGHSRAKGALWRSPFRRAAISKAPRSHRMGDKSWCNSTPMARPTSGCGIETSRRSSSSRWRGSTTGIQSGPRMARGSPSSASGTGCPRSIGRRRTAATWQSCCLRTMQLRGRGRGRRMAPRSLSSRSACMGKATGSRTPISVS